MAALKPPVLCQEISNASKHATVAPTNNNQESTSKNQPNRKALRIFEAIAFAFVGGMSAGYLLGRARSPKFDDPTASPLAIRNYVLQKCRFEPDMTSQSKFGMPVQSAADCVIFRDRNGTITSIGPSVTYLFSCGVVTYAYDAKTRKLQKRPFHPPTDTDYSRPPRTGFTFKETLALLVGGVEGYNLKSMGHQLVDSADTAKESHDSLLMIFYTCAGIISGVLLGLWIGYVKDPKCGEPLFQQLLNDPIFWEGLTEAHSPTKWWRIDHTQEGVHVVRGAAPLPSVYVPITHEPDSLIVARKLILPPHPPVFNEPWGKLSPTLEAILEVLGEHALAKELETWVAKTTELTGLDPQWQL